MDLALRGHAGAVDTTTEPGDERRVDDSLSRQITEWSRINAATLGLRPDHLVALESIHVTCRLETRCCCLPRCLPR
jgi:hypothetical protein